MGKGMVVFVVGLMALTITPVYAEETEKQIGENASDSGKNEIPICQKMVPIDVGIDQEFVEKNRIDTLKRSENGTEGSGSDLVNIIQKYEATKRIEYAIACEIDRLGYLPARPIKIQGNIKDIHLRSTETVIASNLSPLLGTLDRENMPDNLEIMFDVLTPADVRLHRFTVNNSTRKGGVFSKTVPTQRLELMAKAVTTDAIKKMLKASLIREPYSTNTESQPQSIVAALATNNKEVLRRLIKFLSVQQEYHVPIDITILDRVADRIHLSQMETDGDMADTLAHMCKFLGNSDNGKYKQMLLDVSKKAPHKTLRKYAALSAEGLPDGEKSYIPRLALNQ